MLSSTDRKSLALLFAMGLLALAVVFAPTHSMACNGKAKATSSMQKASTDGQDATPVKMANETTTMSDCPSGATSTASAKMTGCPVSGAEVRQASATTSKAAGTCGGTSTSTMHKANAPSCGGTATSAKIMKANATSTKQGWTKEQCISKLMADGMSKTEAEAKYAECLTGGHCTGGAMKTSATAANSSNVPVPVAQESPSMKDENQ
jgi:hypothetical protein